MIKRSILALIFLLHWTPAFANNAEITDRMQGYWDAYSGTDFIAAAEYILPSDLELLKEELLPLFLTAGQSSNPQVRAFADHFFGDTDNGSRKDLSRTEVFARLNQLVAAMSPQTFEILNSSSITVTEISMTDSEHGVVAYQVSIQGTTGEDFERVAKNNSKWYIRLKEAPSTTAGKFRMILGI
ncbi:hypothetical protein [Microbulbifer guangxiensis]|uniref:hypothetical protein n=1 Tax=Microbulbifer guangxiensis TaxID=2904249 RepID=UPI001F1A6CAD|nr:hypothetical protein [Microbulbifer guangxiensis]